MSWCAEGGVGASEGDGRILEGGRFWWRRSGGQAIGFWRWWACDVDGWGKGEIAVAEGDEGGGRAGRKGRGWRDLGCGIGSLVRLVILLLRLHLRLRGLLLHAEVKGQHLDRIISSDPLCFVEDWTFRSNPMVSLSFFIISGDERGPTDRKCGHVDLWVPSTSVGLKPF